VTPISFNTNNILVDFTRLKLVQGKKEEEQKKEREEHERLVAEGKKLDKVNEADITAEFDAADDEDVVF
jgi:hypothetical protein